MMRIKTKKDIEVLKEGGKKLSNIMQQLKSSIESGINSKEVEEITKNLIIKAGGKPAFLGYAPNGKDKYPSALCLSLNDAIVHTPADFGEKIKNGDIVSLDLGFKYKGLITDMATTIAIKEVDAKSAELINITRKALEESIKECKIGVPICNIGRVIENIVVGAGFNVIKDLVGHGVGYEVHEDPVVPNYYEEKMNNIIMKEGLVIAIEPMTTTGDGKIVLDEDGWTYKTSDKEIAVHFEATVAVTKDGPVVLTPIV